MTDTKEILLQALNWGETSPESNRTIIEWSDRTYGLTKFWYSVHLLRLATESFQRPLRIAICGENNSGKSTIVNALIREEIAVTDFFEFTFCPMVFSYGNKEQAKIIYNSDAVIEVDLANLEAKMRSLHGDNELEKIKRIEVTAPKQYLKKYQIADVPGLGADERNAKIAQSFNEEIDVVVFVLNATILGESGLSQDIQKMAERFSHLCLIINKIDQIGYENSDEAIEFVASQSFGVREISIFPMAALDIVTNITAQKWLNDLEEQFLKPVSEAGESIKIVQALEKCYRQLSTLNIFLQSTYHHANRYSILVKVSSKVVETKIESILEKIDTEVNTWVEREAFLELFKEYKKRIEKQKIKSENEARKELEKLLLEIDIQKEVQSLINLVQVFIDEEMSRAEAKIQELQNQVFAPFKIEKTSILLKEEYEKKVGYDLKNEKVKAKSIIEPLPVNSQELTNNEWIFAGGLLTTGILTAVELATEVAFLPALTGGIGLVIPVTKLVTMNWHHLSKWFGQDTDINVEKLEQDLERIRLKLAQEVASKVFPQGAKLAVQPGLEEQFKQWQSQINNTLWNPPGETTQNLSDLADYIQRGETIKTKALEILTEKSQSMGDRLQNHNCANLSPAAVKALEIFADPTYYKVEQVASLREALTQVIELEDIQLSFVDRHCSANELRWLGQIASPQAFIQGWVYDVERDSQRRVEFMEALNQQKINRGEGISLQIVKYTNKDATPLNRYLITGIDWVIELSQSLTELGKKDLRVWAIMDKQDKNKALQLIKDYSAFNSVLQRSGTSDIQSLTL